jgi:hypothetical protein
VDPKGPQTLVEAKAFCAVMAKATHEALTISLTIPKADRPTEMLALHTRFPDMLVAEGVEPVRALILAQGIKVTVWVAEDDN